MKSKLAKLVIAILLGVAIFGALNFEFFQANLRYLLDKPKPSTDALFDEPQEKMEPNRIVIPSLGVDLPIVYAAEVSEGKFQQELQNGVVHYPDTAFPGEYGNVYIFGHSSDYAWAPGNYKQAFATLPHISIGDQIIISDQEGSKYIYRVKETKVVKPDDLSVLDQGNKENRLLTLQTSYPLGTALRRFIVIAQLE